MTEFTYEEIEFEVPVRERHYHYTYRQKVSPAYLVIDIGIDWASIVVHRRPGTPDDRWFVSEFTTGGSIDIPDTTSRDVAVRHAIAKIKALGREAYRKRIGGKLE